jgi:hypothetical protein
MAPPALVPAQLSNRDLLAKIARLAASEREATASLVELLAELDARRLHLAEGCSSLFTYCTERLHLSEQAAYHRIQAARAVRAFPDILPLLRDGSVTLTAVTLLAPHLTGENCEQLLLAARHRSTRDVELLVRSIAPKPDVRATVRTLPTTARNPTTAASTGRELAFTGAGGRSRETGGLEFHHVVPVADGGPARLENVRLICRSHHAYESERWFGEPPGRGDREPDSTAAETRRAPS